MFLGLACFRRRDRGMELDRRIVVNDDVLLKFLSKGLIDVGGDDDKLEHLRQTAADLASILEETPTKVCPFALVAFDPHVPASDPTVVEVEDALRERWQTYVNTFAHTPVTVFRAMLLDALVSVCGRNDTIAAAFVASARNILPLMEVSSEEEIWADIVAEIEKKVEECSESDWATPASISVPDIKLKPPATDEIKITSKKVNIGDLTLKFMAAAGPQYNSPERGHSDTGGNPYWPHDSQEDWNYEFGRRTAQTVGQAITRAVGDLSFEGVDHIQFTEEAARAISEHLTTTLQAVSDAAGGLQRRTNLLWWKEALFSPSARMSYRDMTPFEAAVLMAFDMHQQIPTFSPASVAAFLREAVVTLPTLNQDETASIRELVETTRDADLLSPLRMEVRNLISAPAGRCSVLALIGYPNATHQLDDRGFRDRIGIAQDTELTFSDWSVWIFRELQAARAVAETSVPKRRTARKRTSGK